VQNAIQTLRLLTVAMVLTMIPAGLWANENPKPASTPATPAAEADIKAVVETIESFSGLLDNLGAAAANGVANGVANGIASGEKQAVDKDGRPLKNSIAIITAGAAAGASIGAATKKGTQAIVIGAIAGAAAGLIYDRMTAEKKQPAAEAGSVPAVKSPEAGKQPALIKQPAKAAAVPAS
jgi:hypothetical protein